MGLRLSQATAKPKPLAVPFEGGDLQVTYRPSSYTVAELDELQANSKDTRRIVDSMLRTLVSWDMEREDGTPVPLTTEALTHEVPTSVFVVIMQRMQEDQQPGEAGAPSDAS